MDNFYQTSRDPIWHQFVNGAIILVIGMIAGMVIASSILIEEVTTTELIRRVPSTQTPQQTESGAKTDTPSGFKIEES